MTLNEYQKEALHLATGLNSENKDNMIFDESTLLNIGYAGAIDIIRDYSSRLHEPKKEYIAKELGDCLCYIAVAAKGAGYTLDEIAEMNKSKLRSRYPDGFETEKSLHRKSKDI